MLPSTNLVINIMHAKMAALFSAPHPTGQRQQRAGGRGMTSARDGGNQLKNETLKSILNYVTTVLLPNCCQGNASRLLLQLLSNGRCCQLPSSAALLPKGLTTNNQSHLEFLICVLHVPGRKNSTVRTLYRTNCTVKVAAVH